MLSSWSVDQNAGQTESQPTSNAGRYSNTELPESQEPAKHPQMAHNDGHPVKTRPEEPKDSG